MSRKLVILFAVLAIAHIASGAASTASPSSAYSVAVGAVFANATDTAFTNLQNQCYFTAGFDNTTNYVWCQAQFKSGGTAPADLTSLAWPQSGYQTAYNSLILQRRAINASSPTTKNATLDTKISTSINANDGGAICSGTGYIGILYGYGAGSTNAALTSSVSFAYIAVNGTTATTVSIAANTDATLRTVAQTCFFDNGIFYVIYTQYNTATTPDYTKNKYMIQGVNVTSGAVYYNSTGGVAFLTNTANAISQYSSFQFVPTNWTGYGSTTAYVTYTDSSSDTASATSGAATTDAGVTYKAIPITLATGAAGTVIALGTSGTSTTTITGTESTPTTSTTTVATTYSVGGGFGSLSTYAVVVTKSVVTTIAKTYSNSGTATAVTGFPSSSTAYSSSIFVNGSTSASTTFNLTNPNGYHLLGLSGYSTNGGFGTISMYQPDASSGTQYLVNKDTYYANGTSILSAVSLGTFDYASAPTSWIDPAGSPWLGYTTADSAAAFTGLTLLNGYAGQIALNILSANALTSIFATLAVIIAALFAF